MKKKILCLFFFCLAYTLSAIDYSDGVFFVNEDWYGHNNGSINHLGSNDEWSYRVFQTENPGQQLGCTSQFATIYGGKIFIVSKQDKDPGATVDGSRLAICDASTMKVIKTFSNIGNGADGRSYLGVDEHKGYISTSNGIYLFDTDKMEIVSIIEGTGSDNGGLYSAQVGNMVRVGKFVFAVHQKNGILVVDAATDVIIHTIPGFYGSIVLSKDGNLWASVAKDGTGSGTPLDTILKINPYSFETTEITLPSGMGITNSWYAWTADSFCASNTENKLYWKNNGGWFMSTKIYCFDIATSSITEIYNSADTRWGIYGAGFRVHPVSDEIYCSMFQSFGSNEYEVQRISNSGTILQEYPMEKNYWFPALPVFPDKYSPEISPDFADMKISESTSLPINSLVADKDNFVAAIIAQVVSVENSSIVSAQIIDDALILTPIAPEGSTAITISFNSNGKIATKTIKVTSTKGSGVENIDRAEISVFPNPATEYVDIKSAPESQISIYSLSGSELIRTHASEDITRISLAHFPTGIYLVQVNQHIIKLIKK